MILLFFPHSTYFPFSEGRAHIKATTICLFLSRFVSHTLLSLWPHACAQTETHLCKGTLKNSLISVRLTEGSLQSFCLTVKYLILTDVSCLFFFDRLHVSFQKKKDDACRKIPTFSHYVIISTLTPLASPGQSKATAAAHHLVSPSILPVMFT